MKLNTTIALGAMTAVLALPGMAQATTHHAKHHVKHHAKAHTTVAAAAPQEEGLSTAEQLRLAQEQLAQMQAQINAMQAKVDTAAAPRNDNSAVAAVAAKADTALAAANDAKAAVAKTSKAVSWAADTKVGGNIFFNVSNVYGANTSGAGVYSKNAGNGTGVYVKRIYLTVDHKFNDIFAANITTDASNVVGNTSQYANTAAANSTPATTAGVATTTNSSQSIVGKGLYLKNAYLQAKIDPALIIRVGAAGTPWIPYIDNLAGLRYVDNDLTDRTSFGTSADWGVHVLGDLGKYLNYQVSVTDGAGYRKLYVTKNVDVEGRISANFKGFFAAAGGYTGKLGNAAQGVVTYHTAQRANLAAGYKTDKFVIGGEWFLAKNWTSVTKTTADRDRGYSIFGKYNVTPKWALFGRYDWVKLTADTTKTDRTRDHYANAGIQYEPIKNVDISLVYKRDLVNTSANGAAFSTTNGTIGATGGRGTYDEVGLFGNLKF